MLFLLSAAFAGNVSIDEDILDKLLAKQIACNDLQIMFEEYKLKATKRIDSCSDTLQLNKQIVAEAQSVLSKQGTLLDTTQHQLIVTRKELTTRKRQEPLKMIASFSAGALAGAVAVLVLATAL